MDFISWEVFDTETAELWYCYDFGLLRAVIVRDEHGKIVYDIDGERGREVYSVEDAIAAVLTAL